MPRLEKRRTLNCGVNISTKGVESPSTHTQVLKLVQLNVGQEGRYGYPRFPSRKDVGGNFDLIVYEEEYYPSASGLFKRYNSYASGYRYGYRGYLVVPAYGGVRNSVHNIDAGAFAAEAYSKMKPTKPDMSLANALFELRELPRQLQQRFTRDLKGAANFWVALQFGWLPLLRDVRSFVNIQRNGQKRLAQLIRDSGRPVRRKVLLSNTETTYDTVSTRSYNAFHKIFLTQMYEDGEPRLDRVGGTKTKIWASARYRYWLPPGPRDVEWTNRMLRRIYGLYVTPSVVYNAIPWSWLIDWFSNLGDVIENMDAGVADRLAADYFYTMASHEVWADSHASTVLQGPNGSETPVRVSAHTVNRETRKTRYRGNPFGLSASSELSPMQASILGALGYSRLF